MATTRVPLGDAVGTSTASLFLTARSTITIAPGMATSATSLTLTAPSVLSPDTAEGTSSGSMDLFAIVSAPVPLQPALGVSAAGLLVLGVGRWQWRSEDGWASTDETDWPDEGSDQWASDNEASWPLLS